jgi:hypothetical protein
MGEIVQFINIHFSFAFVASYIDSCATPDLEDIQFSEYFEAFHSVVKNKT